MNTIAYIHLLILHIGNFCITNHIPKQEKDYLLLYRMEDGLFQFIQKSINYFYYLSS